MIETPQIAALIAKLEQRDHLSDEERAALAAIAVMGRHVTAGSDIVREGDSPKDCTLLLSGFAARYNALSDGRRQITAVHIKGDFVDLHSLLLRPMDHSVLALTDCTLALVPHDALRAVTEEFPHLSRMLWLNTLIDSAIHRRWLVAMGRLSASAHFGHFLCELWCRLSVVGQVNGYSFDFPLTQNQVADVLGLSIVHVNRVAQELRQQELISWRAGKLTILEWERLQAVSEFDPTYLQLVEAPR